MKNEKRELNKSKLLTRVGSYSLIASAALLLTPETGNAEIVYSDPDDIVVLHGNELIDIDVDQDGTVDFQLYAVGQNAFSIYPLAHPAIM